MTPLLFVTPPGHDGPMGRSSPWSFLATMPHVSVRFADLPTATGGAVLARRGERVWIVLDRHLTRAERRCALAHELVHLERGTSTRCRWAPRAWDVMVMREELIVDRAVAAWLVPLDDLETAVAAIEDLGGGVTAAMMAEHFEVTTPIASIALEALVVQRARRTA